MSDVNVYTFTQCVKEYDWHVCLLVENKLRFAAFIALTAPEPWSMKSANTSRDGKLQARSRGCKPNFG